MAKAKHIKIPSGGGKAFEVETDDPDDPEVMKEVTVKDLGKADGKYFVDEVKTKVSDSGTTQRKYTRSEGSDHK